MASPGTLTAQNGELQLDLGRDAGGACSGGSMAQPDVGHNPCVLGITSHQT